MTSNALMETQMADLKQALEAHQNVGQHAPPQDNTPPTSLVSAQVFFLELTEVIRIRKL